MTPKEQAESIIKAMNVQNVSGDYTMTNSQIKECALTAVSALIAEHTWALPIAWNNIRKAYWILVKEEILKTN